MDSTAVMLFKKYKKPNFIHVHDLLDAQTNYLTINDRKEIDEINDLLKLPKIDKKKEIFERDDINYGCLNKSVMDFNDELRLKRYKPSPFATYVNTEHHRLGITDYLSNVRESLNKDQFRRKKPNIKFLNPYENNNDALEKEIKKIKLENKKLRKKCMSELSYMQAATPLSVNSSNFVQSKTKLKSLTPQDFYHDDMNIVSNVNLHERKNAWNNIERMLNTRTPINPPCTPNSFFS